MQGVLGFGLTIGLATAIWCLMCGGSILFALLAYSTAGTAASLMTAIFIAMEPHTEYYRD